MWTATFNTLINLCLLAYVLMLHESRLFGALAKGDDGVVGTDKRLRIAHH